MNQELARQSAKQDFIVDGRDANWMIQLARLSRVADRLTVRHFKPTASTIPFVKSLSLENRLFIQSFHDDLVLEKMANTGGT